MSGVCEAAAGALGIGGGSAALNEGEQVAPEVGPAAEEYGICEANAGHIFRDAAGHFAEDTAANRQLLMQAANSANYVGTTNGVATYRMLLPNGQQVWAEVYNGEITNGGVNNVPR